MITTLEQILERALERLATITVTYLPQLLAALVIFGGAYIIARLVRWTLTRMIKAAGLDRFLTQSGVSSMFGGSARVRAAALVSGAAFWLILIIGFLTALSAFDSTLTARMVETLVFLFPKLLTAAAILLVGVWIGQYLGRSTLVWASNEELPYPRRLAAAVRIGINFAAVVVAAYHLDFARSVFLTAFILVFGGAVVTASIAIGIGAHGAVRRRFEETVPANGRREPSLWNHL